jgi:hypothetical protein
MEGHDSAGLPWPVQDCHACAAAMYKPSADTGVIILRAGAVSPIRQTGALGNQY